MRYIMTEIWHNYLLDPSPAPDPDERWLDGCSADAMISTDRAASRDDPATLRGLATYAGPAMVLYSDHDIFRTSSDVVRRRRLPQAIHVTLDDSGHLHWLQNEAAYRDTLPHFYATHGSLLGGVPLGGVSDLHRVRVSRVV
jgi:pimeloyl-ACP methyl ester carboxylesterase